MSSNPAFQRDACLEVSALECLRGFQTLFSDLSFAVHAGEAVHVRGANGSGKTSLLRILCGLSLAESGQVSWNGCDIRGSAAEYRADVSYLGHRPALKHELTPTENLRALIALRGGQPEEPSISAALGEFGIGRRQDRPCRTLSAGQQQRTALARIVLSGAPLWLLDEPATALDSVGIESLESAMDRHLQLGGMIVFTSHQALLPAKHRRDLELTRYHG